jgi:magnesium transporter
VLESVFHFHPLAIEDTRNQRQRPKVEQYEGYLFVILNSVNVTEAFGLAFHEVDAFVGRNYLVTVHRRAEPVIREMRARIARNDRPTLMSAGYLLYQLLDVSVDMYFPVLDKLGDYIEKVENRVLSNPQRDVLDDMFTLRHDMTELWRITGHMRNMFGMLTHHNEVFIKNEVLQYYMRDVFDHLVGISDTVNTYRDLLTGLVELYMSAVSNRLNIVVTRLTVFTIVIGALTVISGFYGMNFEHHEAFWPPLGADWGVTGVLIMMIVVSVVLVFLFKKLNWFE